MAKGTTGEKRATATDRLPRRRAPQATVTHGDVARRAYDLFLTRDGEHGHDVEDWLRAERELTEAARFSES